MTKTIIEENDVIEILEGEVKGFSTNSYVHVPKRHVGKKVKIIVLGENAKDQNEI